MTPYEELLWNHRILIAVAIETVALSRNLRNVAVLRRALAQRTGPPR